MILDWRKRRAEQVKAQTLGIPFEESRALRYRRIARLVNADLRGSRATLVVFESAADNAASTKNMSE